MKNFDELKKEIVTKNIDLVENKIEQAIMDGLVKKQNWVEIKGLCPDYIGEDIFKQQKYSFFKIESSYYICLDGGDIYKYKEEIECKYLKPAKECKSNHKIFFTVFLALFIISSILIIFLGIDSINIVFITISALLILAEVSSWITKDSKWVKSMEKNCEIAAYCDGSKR